MTKIQSRDFIGLIALIFGLVFAAGMFFLAVSLTEKSRDHYQKKLQLSKIDFSSISVIGNDSKPKPPREKSLGETLKFYEIQFLMIVFPLLLFGFALTRLALETLPERNPFQLSDFARRGVLGMVCLILLSTAFSLLYIWFLRIGF